MLSLGRAPVFRGPDTQALDQCVVEVANGRACDISWALRWRQLWAEMANACIAAHGYTRVSTIAAR